MFIILKIIHIAALMAGAATGVGNGILMRKVMMHEGPPPEMAVTTMQTLGKIGPAAMVLLWLTGIPMAYLAYGTLAIGWAFYIKLFGATVALVGAILAARTAAAAAKAGTPPDLKRMKGLSNMIWVGVVIAVVFAVVSFN